MPCHGSSLEFSLSAGHYWVRMERVENLIDYGGLVQRARTPACHAGDRQFESRRSCQKSSSSFRSWSRCQLQDDVLIETLNEPLRNR